MRHEWRTLRREPVFWWASLGLLLTAAYALGGGLAWRAERAEETALTRAESAALLAERRQEAQQGGGRVGGARTFVALPPGPLAAFSSGLADLAPERAEISIFERPDTLFGSYQIESPLSLKAGRFDLDFVVLFLLPLFFASLSYGLIAREREGGTLPMLLMQPVTLSQILGAKLLVRLGLLTLFLALVGAAGWTLSQAPLARLAGWLAVAWLYGAFWLAAAAWIAAFVRRSEACAASLATLWIVLVLVIPGLLSAGVDLASPLPSRLELVGQMRAASSEASKQSAEILARYYHEHPELATEGQQSGFVPAYFASQREVERRLAPLIHDFEDRMGRQQSLIGRWSVLSPAVSAQGALLEFAGSGPRRQRLFAAAARDFLAAWHADLEPAIFLGQALGPEDFDSLPSFSFPEPEAHGPTLALAAVGLLAPSSLALLFAFRRLRRPPHLS
ncbi:MAG: DUF3526 domain-containing protein [Acidobacteriota bacterium]